MKRTSIARQITDAERTNVRSWHLADQVALLVRGPHLGDKRTFNHSRPRLRVLAHALLKDASKHGALDVLVVPQIALDRLS